MTVILLFFAEGFNVVRWTPMQAPMAVHVKACQGGRVFLSLAYVCCVLAALQEDCFWFDRGES